MTKILYKRNWHSVKLVFIRYNGCWKEAGVLLFNRKLRTSTLAFSWPSRAGNIPWVSRVSARVCANVALNWLLFRVTCPNYESARWNITLCFLAQPYSTSAELTPNWEPPVENTSQFQCWPSVMLEILI